MWVGCGVGEVYVCDSIKGSIYFWRFLGLFGIKLFLHFKKTNTFMFLHKGTWSNFSDFVHTFGDFGINRTFIYSHNPWSKHD